MIKEDLFFRWLGVGGVHLRYREKVLLIDPFLTRPSLKVVLLKPLKSNAELLRCEIPHADIILITHAHYDHLMDTAEIINQTGAVAYGSDNVVRLLLAEGVPKEKLIRIHSGDHLEVCHFHIEVIKGKHIPIPFFSSTQLPKKIVTPRRAWDYQMDACFSFFIANTKPSILVWHSIEAKGAIPAEVLIFDSELSLSTFGRLVDLVKPKWAIPIHWDDFFLPLSAPLQPFFRLPERRYLKVGRLHLPSYIERLQYFLPHGRVYLSNRLEEVNLSSMIEAS